jgi:hypothetical protein
VCSDCHHDDDDDDVGISLKSTSNIVFVSAGLLKEAQAFMTKQIVRNPNISTNLKNLPRWEFLDKRPRHVWGKENEWWISILTINDGNHVIQLAVLRFWTLYNVWYSEQNTLEKLELFRYTGKKWWEGTH